MGLDMYLVGHHYHTAYKDDVPRPMLDDKYHIESMILDIGESMQICMVILLILLPMVLMNVKR